MKEKAYTRKQILEAISYWKSQLRKGNCRRVDEGKIGDFFGKLFQTKKFLAKQRELEKAANAEFEKQHPLAAVAKKLSENENYFLFRFTNVDVENDGYPVEASGKADCIVVRYIDPVTNRYDDIKDDEEKILKLVKKYGYQGECVFQPVNSGMAVVMPKSAGNWYVTNINEGKKVGS